MALGNENQHFQRQQQPPATQQMLAARAAYSQHQRPIAPAPAMAHTYASAPYAKPTMPTTIHACVMGTTLDSNNPSVVRRNARERNRVKQVNNGFVHLRQHIPQAIVADLSNGRRGIGPGASKKLSKVDTLKMALEYIRRLQRVIEVVDSGSDTSSVSSYSGGGGSSSSSLSGSPPPQMHANANGDYYQSQAAPHHTQQQHFYPISYAGSFPMQQQQYQPSTMISPAASSTSSSVYSTDSYYHPTIVSNSAAVAATAAPVQVKFEQSFEDFSDDSPSADDDELLDYITHWQQEI